MKHPIGPIASGVGAGALNGLFGAGGGMVLAPMLGLFTDLEETQIFPCSIVILFPICVLSLLFAEGWTDFPFMQALPYLVGSLLGGIGAGKLGQKIPVLWLHRVLGILIIWGGIRYLC